MKLTVVIFAISIIILLSLFFLGIDRVKIGTAALILITVMVLMGIDLMDIGTGILFIIMLALSGMLLFFSLSLIFSFFFRKGIATFDEIKPLKNSDAGWAVYDMDGEKFYCIYPIEFIIVKFFYNPGEVKKIRFFRWKRRNMVFDGYSNIVLFIGFTFSAVFFFILGIVFLTLIA